MMNNHELSLFFYKKSSIDLPAPDKLMAFYKAQQFFDNPLLQCPYDEDVAQYIAHRDGTRFRIAKEKGLARD